MKVIHFSTRLTDGAGRATYRLHKGLLELGVNSICIVKYKEVNDDTVIQLFRNNLSNPLDQPNSKSNIFKHSLETIPFLFREFLQRYKTNKYKPDTLFNYNIPFISLNKIKNIIASANIVCLHSIQHFLSSKIINKIYSISQAPIVWIMMDIEPITGGCHFNNHCERYTEKCGNCPQLELSNENDLSRQVWSKKNKYLAELPITLVAPTSNSQKQAKKSSLFNGNRVENILLSTDNTLYKEVDKTTARKALKLPVNKKIILFAAYNLSDERKGGKLLLEALDRLNDKITDSKELRNSVVLLTMGENNSFDASNLPIDWIHLGPVTDDRFLKLVYYSCDIYTCPSIDDMGPSMINEAYSCGLPVIAFDSGVGPDLIVHSKNGYLIKNHNVDQFADYLFKCLFDREIIENIENNTVSKDKCSQEIQAKSYLKLFKQLTIN